MERNEIQLSQRVTPSLAKKLKSVAKRKRIKRSELIREALLTYISTIEKPNKQAKRKTLSA